MSNCRMKNLKKNMMHTEYSTQISLGYHLKAKHARYNIERVLFWNVFCSVMLDITKFLPYEIPRGAEYAAQAFQAL